jgi:hypothetical protein
MTKDQAISMLGGTVASAAKQLGVSYQAVDKWPKDLPPRISDRVLGAYTRSSHPELARDFVAHGEREGVAHG